VSTDYCSNLCLRELSLCLVMNLRLVSFGNSQKFNSCFPIDSVWSTLITERTALDWTVMSNHISCKCMEIFYCFFPEILVIISFMVEGSCLVWVLQVSMLAIVASNLFSMEVFLAVGSGRRIWNKILYLHIFVGNS